MLTNASRTRRRVVPRTFSGIVPLGYYQFWNSSLKKWNSPTLQQVSNLNLLPKSSEAQVTVDEIHEGPPYYDGGEFKSLRLWRCIPFVGVLGNGTYERQDGLQRYVGGFNMPSEDKFGADWNTFNTQYSALSSDSSYFPSMDGLGDRAYNSTKPHLEKAGGAVFLAELSDLPRMLQTTSRGFRDIWLQYFGNHVSKKFMTPKKVADHFINHNFGWIPFISDMSKFVNTFDKSEQIIKRLSDQNNRWVRRRVTLDDVTSESVLSSGSGMVCFPNNYLVNNGGLSYFNPAASWQLSERVETSTWAVGKFRYYRPEFDLDSPDYSSALAEVGRQLTIYGVRISPANIYKATPWSWAADWVSKAGDHVNHLNDILVDSIASKYCFAMQRQTRIRKLVQVLPFRSGTVCLEFERIVQTKERREGTSPYGFGLTLANLTPRQIAIAGALGVSRV